METIINLIQQAASIVIPFVILLGILIFVHELGHFMVARWCGVRVEVFSLGFGKKLFKYTKGDTTYALSMIPLGGYVKMFGEQPGDHIKPEDRAVSFTHKNVWQRIAIVLAGPLMNFFFAILLFFVVAMTGESARKATIGDVKPSSAAYAAGFKSGDTIVNINNTIEVQSWEDLQRFLSQKEKKDIQFTVGVKREGSESIETLSVTAVSKENPNILSRFDYVAEVEGLSLYSKGTTVGVPTSSPLYTLGLRTGDTIKSVNSASVSNWRDLTNRMSIASAKETLTLEVSGTRDNEVEPKNFTITLAPTETIKSYNLDTMGIEGSDLYLSKVVEKSPAAEAGLLAGDRIIKINNTKINEWEEVITNIKSFDGKEPVSISVSRENQIVDLKITPQISAQTNAYGGEEKRYTIGIVPFANVADINIINVKSKNLGAGLVKGVSHTWDYSVMTVLSFVRLFENKISPKHIGGVLSIGQAASETFKMGINYFLQMMALISVNLFVLNLLPVPVLDGGHLVFYAIEVVKGAPLSLKKMEIAQQVGMVLLMSLMVFALFNDFSRIFGL